MTYRTITDLALETECSFCGAKPWAWCVTRSHAARGMSRQRAFREPATGTANWLHSARTDLLQEAWRSGHWHGRFGALAAQAQQYRAAFEGAFWARGIPVPTEATVLRMEKDAERAQASDF